MVSVSQSTGSGTSFIPDYAQSGFLQMIANEANNYANQAYGRYDSTFQPLENALISDAQKFQSPDYLRQVGGAASAGAAQAGEAQRTNSLRDLQAFGIDPSGGRYAELDKAERGRTAATQAGASQEAMRQTQQAGRDMRMQAINIGQQNLNRAEQNLNTAASLKYPPLGQSHTQQMTSSGGSMLTSGGARMSSDNSPGSSANRATGNNPSGGTPQSGYGPGGGTTSGGGGSAVFAPAGVSPGPDQPPGSWDAPVNDTRFTDYSVGNNYQFGGQNDPLSSVYGGYNTGGGTNPGADQYSGENTNAATNPSFTTDYNNPWGDTNATNPAPIDNSSTGSWPADNSSGANSQAGWSPTDNQDYSGGFAAGGAIDIQDGGHVPQEASPSQGTQTDDITANVNADEFVIPKDVALWKGQEFFQKLIATSRKARLTAPAHGSNDNGQPQPAMG